LSENGTHFEGEIDCEPRNWGPEIGLAVGKFIIVAGGGLLVGIVYGFIGAYLTKFTKHAPIIEPLIVYACAYLAYLTAEWIQLSSILAIVFAGFFMRGFVEENMDTHSVSSLHYVMKLLSNVMDITIFIFLGISAISDFWAHWNTGFVIWTIIFITIYRVISVYTLTYILNIGRLDRISYVDQFIMAYGGLRGGIAFSLCKLMCVQLVPSIQNLLCATVIAVFFTSFIQGMTIGPIVEWLQVKKQEKQEQTVGQEVVTTMVDHFMTGVSDILGDHGRHWWMQRLNRLTAQHLTPILQREPDKFQNKNIIDVWQDVNLAEAATIVKKQTNVNQAGQEMDDTEIQMVRLLLPGAMPEPEPEEDEDVVRDKKEVDLSSGRVKDSLDMHNMLRDNLYANRQRVELAGHVKYRRLQNEANMSMKKQQHEILVRRRIKDIRENPAERQFRKTMRKTNLNRKTTHKTDLKLKTESMKSNAKNQSSKNQGPISPLAMERSPQPTERTPLTSETDGAASSPLPWRTASSADPQPQRSTMGRPKSQLYDNEKA